MKTNAHDDDGFSINKKAAANRGNAQLSTGPKTDEGKSRSRRNALKHGILASALLVKSINGTEDQAQFDGLLSSLCRDLSPVGILEEMLVEKIAVCWWRQKRALRREAVVIKGTMGSGHFELGYFEDPVSVPFGAELDRILRYETSINRQWAYAINQLERLQRARKGEHVPAPVSVQVSRDE